MSEVDETQQVPSTSLVNGADSAASDNVSTQVTPDASDSVVDSPGSAVDATGLAPTSEVHTPMGVAGDTGTGDSRVDAAMAQLAGVDVNSPEEALGQLTQVHDRLQRVLSQP